MSKKLAGKTVIKLDGKVVAFANFYNHFSEIRKGIMVCTDDMDKVLSIENTSKYDTYNVFYKDALLTGLPPGNRFSFGSLNIKSSDLSVATKPSLSGYDDDCEDSEEEREYGDCHD